MRLELVPAGGRTEETLMDAVETLRQELGCACSNLWDQESDDKVRWGISRAAGTVQDLPSTHRLADFLEAAKRALDGLIEWYLKLSREMKGSDYQKVLEGVHRVQEEVARKRSLLKDADAAASPSDPSAGPTESPVGGPTVTMESRSALDDAIESVKETLYRLIFGLCQEEGYEDTSVAIAYVADHCRDRHESTVRYCTTEILVRMLELGWIELGREPEDAEVDYDDEERDYTFISWNLNPAEARERLRRNWDAAVAAGKPLPTGSDLGRMKITREGRDALSNPRRMASADPGRYSEVERLQAEIVAVCDDFSVRAQFGPDADEYTARDKVRGFRAARAVIETTPLDPSRAVYLDRLLRELSREVEKLKDSPKDPDHWGVAAVNSIAARVLRLKNEQQGGPSIPSPAPLLPEPAAVQESILLAALKACTEFHATLTRLSDVIRTFESEPSVRPVTLAVLRKFLTQGWIRMGHRVPETLQFVEWDVPVGAAIERTDRLWQEAGHVHLIQPIPWFNATPEGHRQLWSKEGAHE